MKTGGAPPR